MHIILFTLNFISQLKYVLREQNKEIEKQKIFFNHYEIQITIKKIVHYPYNSNSNTQQDNYHTQKKNDSFHISW